jgi:FemAB-related protein (PEP-CTERM system-associated)
MIVELCRMAPGNEKAWDEYAYQCSEASHCHLSGWRRVVERVYRHQAFYLWARENGAIKGILPLILMRSVLFSPSLVSLPFLDDGGICADDETAREALYREALHLCDKHEIKFLDLRHRLANGLDIPVCTSKATLVLELVNSSEQMWRTLDPKVRNQVRKATKSGLTTSWYGLDGLNDFYAIIASNMRDLGSPVHSRKFFASIIEEFSDSARILLVRKETQPVAGAFCISFKDVLLVPWASARREHLSLCPNNLAYWEMIRWGCENKYRWFDFGRSSLGSGTYQFKKHWGAVERPLYWQTLATADDGRNARLHADSPTCQWMIQTWRRLPLSMTNLIGPLVRGQISS